MTKEITEQDGHKTMVGKILCDVYKTSSKDEMYLYVAQQDGLSKLPDELLQIFTRPEKTMTIILSPGKSLGRANVEDVMESINDKGFYLQMPPARETYMLDLFCKRDSDHDIPVLGS